MCREAWRCDGFGGRHKPKGPFRMCSCLVTDGFRRCGALGIVDLQRIALEVSV